jgi:hypothetical protein
VLAACATGKTAYSHDLPENVAKSERYNIALMCLLIAATGMTMGLRFGLSVRGLW